MVIAISGGKGGTGKSVVAVNVSAVLARERKLVLADLDAEAPNDHILLGARLRNEKPVNVMLPFIDYSRCTRCGECAEVCGTGAILLSPDKTPFVIPRLCSGCRSCYFACPVRAIEEGWRTIGYTYETMVELDGAAFTLVTVMLREGEEHVPPAVLAGKRRALGIEADLHLIDTSAGSSNTVSTALYGSKLMVAVTEPTPLGLHDLEMILDVAEALGIESWVVMNKAGIGPEEKHMEVVKERGSRLVARIPYSNELIDSYVRGKPIVEYRPESEAARALIKLAELIGEAA